MDNILNKLMDEVTEERFKKQNKEISYIFIYSAVCSTGFSSEPITEKMAEFKIARQILMYENKTEKQLSTRLKELYKTPLGEKFFIKSNSENSSYLVKIKPFVIVNKEYAK